MLIQFPKILTGSDFKDKTQFKWGRTITPIAGTYFFCIYGNLNTSNVAFRATTTWCLLDGTRICERHDVARSMPRRGTNQHANPNFADFKGKF